jgi:hypothetical protein
VVVVHAQTNEDGPALGLLREQLPAPRQLDRQVRVLLEGDALGVVAVDAG